MLVLATILFILLSPGTIITLDPTRQLLFSQQTTGLAILVHATLFFTLLKLSHDKTFPFNYLADVETTITGANF